MTRMRRLGVAFAFACLAASALPASPASDFGARLGQTVWALQQVEALVRALPQSSREAAVPETVTSYMVLVTENVHALSAIAVEKTTDEQRRVMAAGLNGVASMLRDESALAANRGLSSTAAGLGSLETACRSALTGF
jgi:hypothetical protein